MNNFKHSNHDVVLLNGMNNIEKSIDNIDKYEVWGTENALLTLREGVDAVIRLGEESVKTKVFRMLSIKLKKMYVEQCNYLNSEDKTATSYLDHTRRVRAIALLEDYLENNKGRD